MQQIAQNLQARIGICEHVNQLRTLRDHVQAMLHDCLPFADIADWYRVTNDCQDQLIRHAIRLAERQVIGETGKRPAGTYAFLLFGSAGRSEQTLWSDQDNGLIYSDADEESRIYYAMLAAAIEQALKAIGYPPCSGNVVAGNELWRKPLHEWRTMLAEWFEDGSWENVRQLLLVADARTIYGDEALAERLRQEYLRWLGRSPDMIGLMLRNTLRHKVVLGPLGNLIREPYGEDAGGFDVKYGAYIPMVNAIRLLAIRHRLPHTATLERVEGLRPQLGSGKADRMRDAFLHILKLRAMTPHWLDEEGCYMTRGKLRPQDLTGPVIAALKSSLRIGKELQRQIGKLV